MARESKLRTPSSPREEQPADDLTPSQLDAFLRDNDIADLINQQRGCFSQKYVLPQKQQLFSNKDKNEKEPSESLLSDIDVDNMLLNNECQHN